MSTETAKPSGRFTTGLKRFLFGSGQTLESIFASRSNGLNLVRLFLATGVLASHSFALLGQPIPNLPPPIARLLDGGTMVDGFFIISGFLVMRSATQASSFRTYAANRVFRIFPALFVCLAFTAVLLAPLMALHEHKNLAWYEAPLYIAANIFLFPMHWGISNLLLNNPVSRSWNGSLWTLQFEVLAYIVLWFAVRRLRASSLGISCFLLVALVFASALPYGFLIAYVDRGLHDLLFQFGRLGSMFAIGVICSKYSNRVGLSWFWLALSLATLALAAYAEIVYRLVGGFAMAYILLFVGAKLKLPRFLSNNDFSYGLYIYAFPVQQSLIGFGVAATLPGEFALQVLTATAVLAAASWYLVEEPSMRRLKPKFLAFADRNFRG